VSGSIGFIPSSTSGSSGGSSSGVDASITSWAQLAAIPTAGESKPIVKVWVEAGDHAAKTTELRAGTDATDTANGIQRPNDYGPSNQFVWYQA
jgi:hypothetical protein